MKKRKSAFVGDIESSVPEIYLTIDHLKKGPYTIHIVENNLVLKSIKILKS
jgi:hypothetical protein